MFIFFFFFQAEDGIRAFHVTGVQTCALPILGQNHGDKAASADCSLPSAIDCLLFAVCCLLFPSISRVLISTLRPKTRIKSVRTIRISGGKNNKKPRISLSFLEAN